MGLIADTVAGVEALSNLSRWMTSTCEGSKYHSPTPLQVRPVWLTTFVFEVAGKEPAKSEARDEVCLCSNCESNLRVFCALMLHSHGALSWEVRREFGNRIRDLGMQAWEYYTERQHSSA